MPKARQTLTLRDNSLRRETTVRSRNRFASPGDRVNSYVGCARLSMTSERRLVHLRRSIRIARSRTTPNAIRARD